MCIVKENYLPVCLGYKLLHDELTVDEVNDRIAFYNKWSNEDLVPYCTIDDVIEQVLILKQMDREELKVVEIDSVVQETSYRLALDFLNENKF